MALLSHRGPDDSGLESTTVDGYHVAFGHRRLAIVDLSSAGHQPMQSPSSGNLLIFNGEIYNHQALRKKMPGYAYRGSSDTETILSTIEHHGIERICEFNGIFAFAYLDKSNKKVILARDPFGVKPLYYWLQGDKMIFCSELKPLTTILPETSVDPIALATLLKLRFLPSPLTLIKNIKKLNPGYIAEVDLDSPALKIKQYAYKDAYPNSREISFSDAVDLYEQHFSRAVESQLMADVDVGTLLSGGIDSAMVSAVASKKSPYKVKAFTIGFDEEDETNEIEAAAETARVLGLDHYYRRIGHQDFFDTLQKTSSVVEEPLATDSIVPMHFLCELASQHVKVVLTGQGADEPLGGYRRYQGELLLQKTPGVLRSMSPWLAHLTKNEPILRALGATGIQNDLDRFLEIYTLFTDEEVGRLVGTQHRHIALPLLENVSKSLNFRDHHNPVAKMMAIDLRFNLSDDLLLYTDKIAMQHSLEARVPMLDNDLIAFLETLPTKYKVRIGQGKIIHKELAKRFLPDSIVRRKKLGFLSPTVKWLRKNEGIVRDILLSPNSRLSGYIDTTAVEQVLTQHSSGYDKRKQIFLLLNLYFWLEEFTVKKK